MNKVTTPNKSIYEQKLTTINHNLIRRSIQLGYLIAILLTVYIIESLLLLPFGFIRIGLANVIVIYALYRLPTKSAVFLSIAKVVIGGLILGTAFTPIFPMNLAASLLSVLAMVIVYKALRRRFMHPIFVSMPGALVHSVAQLGYIYLWTGSKYVFYLVPMLAIVALASGAVVGVVSEMILNQSKHKSKRNYYETSY